MIFLFQALHICCASIIIVFSLAFANSETWTIPIDYAIKSLKFQRLGSINLRKQYDGNYTAEFDFETPEVIDLLQKNLLASKTDKKQPPDYILKCDNLFSSNYAQDFVSSDYSHSIELMVDSTQRTILSLTHFPKVITSRKTRGKDPIIDVNVNAIAEHIGPDTATYLQRLEEERKARQHGATQDNRSFLAKYWMYILPVVIFMVFSNAFAGEQPANEEG